MPTTDRATQNWRNGTQNWRSSTQNCRSFPWRRPPKNQYKAARPRPYRAGRAPLVGWGALARPGGVRLRHANSTQRRTDGSRPLGSRRHEPTRHTPTPPTAPPRPGGAGLATARPACCPWRRSWASGRPTPRPAFDARVKGVARGPVTGLAPARRGAGRRAAAGPARRPRRARAWGRRPSPCRSAATCGFPALYVTAEMRPLELLQAPHGAGDRDLPGQAQERGAGAGGLPGQGAGGRRGGAPAGPRRRLRRLRLARLAARGGRSPCGGTRATCCWWWTASTAGARRRRRRT